MDRQNPPMGERIASMMLRGGVSTAVLLLCAFQLATWIPHFLTWPFFVDHDVFANLALGWDRGVLPYRDFRANNFPGTITLFWILGQVFGWGRTWPIFAVDAGFVVLFGSAMIRWSWRSSRQVLPGAIGFASFLAYYLGLDETRVFQRDWHAPLFVILGWMIAEGRRDRVGLVVSALLAALAFSIRPQVVLLFPAVLACFAHDREGSPRRFREVVRAWAGWALLLAIFAAILAGPIVGQGLWGDLVAGVRLTAYGASYNQASWARILKVSSLQALNLEFVVVPAAILLLMGRVSPKTRVSAWTCLLALAGAWWYKPLSPVPWPYLAHPYHVVLAVGVAMLVRMILEVEWGSATLRLTTVLFVILGVGVVVRPEFCSVQASLEALKTLRAGLPGETAPLGYASRLATDPDDEKPYPWADYRDLIRHLRDQTPPGAKVANLLVKAPALVGPTGRLSALPAESLAWLVVAPGDEPRFLEAITNADPETVVVWSPEEADPGGTNRLSGPVRNLAPAIRRLYRPWVRFGRIEVWKRAVGPPD